MCAYQDTCPQRHRESIQPFCTVVPPVRPHLPSYQSVFHVCMHAFIQRALIEGLLSQAPF